MLWLCSDRLYHWTDFGDLLGNVMGRDRVFLRLCLPHWVLSLESSSILVSPVHRWHFRQQELETSANWTDSCPCGTESRCNLCDIKEETGNWGRRYDLRDERNTKEDGVSEDMYQSNGSTKSTGARLKCNHHSVNSEQEPHWVYLARCLSEESALKRQEWVAWVS